ncbi:head GIN domain-containing protein [Janthinobacterium lividum]|uniref:Head GIN domain-containing protein n=1 Tax=Janthinobacterium lividum TaxID=29581 RepID=A0ABU0XT70_9BURK|nr:head GIN domain-containing protein [Janthinobacterium lividum]MDQ4626722.1 head GIN domain-containing protein [Janthinobacterium lividum]MDQ4674311.1 head GIN domain-containing protein [Janthinobacterium lividum]MDQ4685042.1 head GIN domain-containing protein [Janthinobacterium lividum]
MRTLLALCCAVVLGGCAIVINPNDGEVRYAESGGNAIQGNGQVSRDVRQVGNITALDIDNMKRIDIKIDVRVGPTASLVIEADNNLQPLIHSDVNGNTLRIWSDTNIRSSNGIHVIYTTPQLKKINISGSGRLVVSGLNGDDFSLEQRGSMKSELSGSVGRFDVANNGSGSINAAALTSGNTDAVQNASGSIQVGNVRGERINVAVNGSGSISASGIVQRLDANVNGSGDINLASLRSDVAYLASNGSGDIDVTVQHEVNARASGSGRITVHGDPARRTLSGKRVSIVR